MQGKTEKLLEKLGKLGDKLSGSRISLSASIMLLKETARLQSDLEKTAFGKTGEVLILKEGSGGSFRLDKFEEE